MTADDVRALLALGVTRAQIEDALNVGFAFNVITRLADTFEFEVGSRASFDAGARPCSDAATNSQKKSGGGDSHASR